MKQGTCSVDGCDVAACTKGLCRRHYAAKWYRDRLRDRPPRRNTHPAFNCLNCGRTVVPGEDGVGANAKKFCSKRCKAQWHYALNPRAAKHVGPSCRIGWRPRRGQWVEGACVECGERFVRGLNGGDSAVGYCCERCKRRAANRRRRALKAGVGYKALTFRAIAERDRWTCQLCGEPVDREADVPDLHAPTLDHIVPLYSGGSHSEDNAQLAHFICNSRKGSGMSVPIGGQLSMV